MARLIVASRARSRGVARRALSLRLPGARRRRLAAQRGAARGHGEPRRSTDAAGRADRLRRRPRRRRVTPAQVVFALALAAVVVGVGRFTVALRALGAHGRRLGRRRGAGWRGFAARERPRVQRWAFVAAPRHRRGDLRLPAPPRLRRRLFSISASRVRRGPRALRHGPMRVFESLPPVRDPLPHLQRAPARARDRRRRPRRSGAPAARRRPSPTVALAGSRDRPRVS